jgi:hypothetical protein
MNRHSAILFLLFFSLTGSAQVVFKTIAPTTQVVAGESFRIQYYVEGSTAHELTPPDFGPFRLVEGPDVYPGKASGAGIVSKNYVYTLVAPSPGNYLIPGASLRTGGSIMESSTARITVIPAKVMEQLNKQNGPTGFYLAPGERAEDKIRKELFLRVSTDRKTCYVGEPVLVTYKLYSTLQSVSEIIKNPGFYGFTVHDMIGLQDQQLSTELINGKSFNVHIIRKLQLYPLQAGRFTIDPMEVKSMVEFSKTEQSRETQQQIVEGVNRRHILSNVLSKEENDFPKEGQLIVENQMRTEPIEILVNPIPEKSKPAEFNSAVGKFTVKASLEKSSLARNEEGFLLLTIEGKGNFIQLVAPEIAWPSGVEGFGAVVKDSLDREKMPLTGFRQFRYGFVCTAAGTYTLPAIRFSFFDPDSNRYRNLITDPVPVTVTQEVRKEVVNEEHKLSIAELSQRKSRIAIIVVFLLVSSVLAFWVLKKKPVEEKPVVAEVQKPDMAGIFAAAEEVVESEAAIFCAALLRCVWDYFQPFATITGSARNKEHLYALLRAKGVAAIDIDTLAAIFSTCETGIYTHAVPGKSNEELLTETRELMEQLNQILF